MTAVVNDRWEWVEIIEPKTKETMFVNLSSGDCVWHPPDNVAVKRMDKNQWWELYDTRTCRFYYYNAFSEKTVWQKPINSDIIPLAKLQILKQNTEVNSEKSRREIFTQTTNCPELSLLKRKVSRSNTCAYSPSHPQSSYWQLISRENLPSTPPSRQDVNSSEEGNDSFLMMMMMMMNNGNLPGNGSGALFSSTSLPESEGGISGDPGSYLSQESSDSGCHARLIRESAKPIPQSRQLKSNFQSESAPLYDNPPPSLPSKNAPPSSHMMSSETSVDSGVPPDSWDSSSNLLENIHPLTNSHNQHKSLHPSSSATMSRNCGGFSASSFKERSATIDRTPKNNSALHTSSFTPQCRQRNFPRTNPIFMRASNTTVRRDPASNLSHSPVASSTFTSVQPVKFNGKFVSENSFQPIKPITVTTDSSYNNSGERQSCLDAYSAPNTGDSLSSSSNTTNTTLGDSSLTSPASSSYLTTFSQQSGSPTQQVRSAGVNLLKTRERELIRLNRNIEVTPMAAPSSPSLSHTSGEGAAISSSCNSPQLSSLLTRPQSMLLQPISVPIHPRHQHTGSDDLAASPLVLSEEAAIAELASSTGKVSSTATIASTTSSNGATPPARSHSSGFSHHNSSQNASNSSSVSNLLTTAAKVAAGEQSPATFPGWSRSLFRKEMPLNKLLSFQKDSIQKPLLLSTEKSLKKQACDIFKHIQMYMGDRKAKLSLPDLALSVSQRGWAMANIRDEIFMQLCKQTSQNPSMKSITRGWDLMCICLNFFPPSVDFQPFLEGFIQRHINSPLHSPILDRVGSQTPHQEILEEDDSQGEKVIDKEILDRQIKVAMRRLRRIIQSGARRGTHCLSVDEVRVAKTSILHPGLFGSTLEEIMAMQNTMFPDRQLPWIQVVLSEEVLRLNGAHTEGIFRVSGDIDLVNELKVHTEKWLDPSSLTSSASLLANSEGAASSPGHRDAASNSLKNDDPHVPASLLKLWYRELGEPLIPDAFYSQCLSVYDDPEQAASIVDNLPTLNKNCLKYLVKFLQVFAAEKSASKTKMDVNNLAMVMAPNVLRANSSDPHVIFNNTRPQMAFLRTLILHLDTSDIVGIR